MQLIFSQPSATSTAVPCPVDVGDSLAWFERDTPWSRFKTPLWKSNLAPIKPDFDTDHSVAGFGTQNHARTIDQFLGLGNSSVSALGGNPEGFSGTEAKWRPKIQSHISALFGRVLFPSGEARAFIESQLYPNGNENPGQSSFRCPILGCSYEDTMESKIHKHLDVSLLKSTLKGAALTSRDSNTTVVSTFLRTQMVHFLRLFLNNFNTTSVRLIHSYRIRWSPLPLESVWSSIGPS